MNQDQTTIVVDIEIRKVYKIRARKGDSKYGIAILYDGDNTPKALQVDSLISFGKRILIHYDYYKLKEHQPYKEVVFIDHGSNISTLKGWCGID